MTVQDYTKGALAITTVTLLAFGVLALQGIAPQSIYMPIVIGFTVGNAALAIWLVYRSGGSWQCSDERDKAIEARAHRNGYTFAFAALNALLLVVVFDDLLEIDWLGTPAIFHALFLATFGAHFIVLTTQLYYYSRGLE